MPEIDWSNTPSGFELPSVVPMHQRNSTMHRYLSSLRGKGATDEQIEAEAFKANAEHFQPVIDDAELMRIVRSVCTYDVGDGTWHSEAAKVIVPSNLPTISREVPTSVLPDLSGMTAIEQAHAYIAACFDEDDTVCLSRNLMDPEDDVYHYAGTLLGLCGWEPLENMLPRVGSGGMWCCVNPLLPDKYHRSKEYVAEYKNVLVECDDLPMDEQLPLMLKLFWGTKMLRAIVDSGGKSYHCILRVGARTRPDYAQIVSVLYATCEKHGLKVDRQCSNPTRMTRLAGAERSETGRTQKLVWAYGI